MYPGWQPMQSQFHMVPFQPQAGWIPQPMPMQPMHMMGGMAPSTAVPIGSTQMPPPPGEDNPPLPPDPPPEDNSEESELKPKDPQEQQKLQDLKNQAAQWQQTQQIWGQPGIGMGFQTPLDLVKKEEEEFNVQFKEWRKQYDDWRDQNKSHPNKDQYNQYLQQWQTYEKQMEEKKADILRRKEEAKKQMREQEKAAAKGQPFSNQQSMMGMGGMTGFGGPPPPRPFSGPPPGPNFRGPPPGPRMRPPQGPRGQFGGSGMPPSNNSSIDNNNSGMGRGQSFGARGRGRGGPNNFGQGQPPQPSQIDKTADDGMDTTESNDNAEEGIDKEFNALLNSSNPKVNKFMLKKINNDGRQMLCKLEAAGKIFVKEYINFNPAQLNRLVKVINDIGDESVMLQKIGGVTPPILARMKNEVLNVLGHFGVNVPDAGRAGRGRGNEMDKGRGRGGDKDMGRGRGGSMDMTRGRGGQQRGGMQFGRGGGRGNFHGNRFGQSEQYEEFDTQQEGDYSMDGDNNEGPGKPPAPEKKGPVSLFDLKFDEPPSNKKSGNDKNNTSDGPKKFGQSNQTGGTPQDGGMMGRGGPRGSGPQPLMSQNIRPGMRPRGMMGQRGMGMGPRGPRPMGGMRQYLPPQQPEVFQGEVFEPPPEDVKPSVSSSPSTPVGLSVPTTSSSVAASVETKDVKKELEDSSRMSNVTVKSENKLEEKRPPLPSMKSEFDIENNIKFEQQNEPGQDFYQGGDHNEGDYHEHDSGQFQAQNEQFQSGQFYRQGGGQFQDQGQSNRFSVQDGGQFSDRQMDRDRNQRGPRGRGGGRGRGRGRGQDWEQQDNSSNTRMPAQGRGFRGQNNENNRFERDRSQDRRRYQDPNESWNQDNQYENEGQFGNTDYEQQPEVNTPQDTQPQHPGPGNVQYHEDSQGAEEPIRDRFHDEYRPPVPPGPPEHDRFRDEHLDRGRDPYRREDPYARYPYRDPYADRHDPYFNRRDPYARYPPYPRDPYDPYARRPYDDPYRRGYDERFDPYSRGPPVPERLEFKPAETIDYGHKPTTSDRDEQQVYQAPAVIDYAHGQSSSDKSFPARSTPSSSASETVNRAPAPMDRNFPSPFISRNPPGPPPGPPLGPPPEQKVEVVKVEDILCTPGRNNRPQQIVVVVRGLPGSGKTYVSKLIKDKEVAEGGKSANAPRMLSLDDYFLIEVDRMEKDPDTGKRVKKKVLEYEYEAEMESAYRQSMLKSFKKSIDDGFFPFIIVDAVFDRIKHFEEFWSYAKSKGFQVYVVELQCDVSVCTKRNVHKRTQREIEKLHNKWEETPAHYIKLDIRSLLQEDSITDVEMEDTDNAPPPAAQPPETKNEEEEDSGHFTKSKWELDLSEGNLDKLDGLVHQKKHAAQSAKASMDEFLQLADEYFAKQIQEPGKKRVRWADLEERKESAYRRDLGFVVGQTQQDWQRITDPHYAERQLNRTKYI